MLLDIYILINIKLVYYDELLNKETQAELNRFGLRFLWYTRQESNL